MTLSSVSLISDTQPSEVFRSHDVATWIDYLASKRDIASKRDMHGAAPYVQVRFLVGFSCGAIAMLAFAGLHELSEMLQSCFHVGGFFLFATVTHYPVSFVFVLHGPGFARVCCASQDFLTRARTPMKHWLRGSWCAATVFAL